VHPALGGVSLQARIAVPRRRASSATIARRADAAAIAMAARDFSLSSITSASY